MTTTSAATLAQIHALLAERGYEVSESAPDTLKIRELSSGVTIQAVLQGEIMFFTLPCTVVPQSAITAEIMAKMLEADNGISTSHFQLYDAGDGKVAITLNNFCKLQEMGPDDEDDILSCVHFLFVDVMSARRLLAGLVS
jgi:predicted PhzF superfamily epimerase YddE/YHI9